LEWIGENLQFVVPVVLFILFSFLSKQKEEEDVAPPPSPRRNFGEDEGAADELAAEQRAEQIREEIRRRIHERMGGAPEQPLPPELVELDEAPEPPPVPVYRNAEPPPAPKAPQPVARAVPDVSDLDSGAASRGIAEQFQRLEEARRLANETAMNFRHSSDAFDRNPNDNPPMNRSHPASAGHRLTAEGLRGELLDREGARRAIVLQEVLGKPLSLRAPVGHNL
jgi:hypothetical protein